VKFNSWVKLNFTSRLSPTLLIKIEKMEIFLQINLVLHIIGGEIALGIAPIALSVSKWSKAHKFFGWIRLRILLKESKEMDAIVARERVAEFKNWLDR